MNVTNNVTAFFKTLPPLFTRVSQSKTRVSVVIASTFALLAILTAGVWRWKTRAGKDLNQIPTEDTPPKTETATHVLMKTNYYTWSRRSATFWGNQDTIEEKL